MYVKLAVIDDKLELLASNVLSDSQGVSIFFRKRNKMKFKITIDIELNNTSCYSDDRSYQDKVRDARTHIHQ